MNTQEQWISSRALAYLYGDDASPDVGMGMSINEAVERALDDAAEGAATFGGLLGPVNKDTIFAHVRSKR